MFVNNELVSLSGRSPLEWTWTLLVERTLNFLKQWHRVFMEQMLQTGSYFPRYIGTVLPSSQALRPSLKGPAGPGNSKNTSNNKILSSASFFAIPAYLKN